MRTITRSFWLVLGLAMILLSAGCTRSNVEDPAIIGPSSQRLSVEGWANPPTLYIPLDLTTQVTTITVRVYSYDQLPLAGRQVLFQQFEADQATGMSWGCFEGGQKSVKKTLDSQGYAQVKYYFPQDYTVTQDYVIYIKASLLNIETLRNEVYDYIPVFLKVYEN